MTTSFTLSEEYIFRIAPDGKSTRAALELLQRNAFRRARITQHGTRLEADCHGSEPRPYSVLVDLENPTSPRIGCTCASMKHPCKHALGLLYLALRAPEQFDLDESSRQRRTPDHITTTHARDDSPAEQQAPHSTEEAILRDIFDHPEDDTPRLIYADWLDEHGGAVEQARATFIRLQIDLANLPPDAPRPAKLLTQERKLWAAHRDTWLESFPARLRSRRELRFRRGFFEELRPPFKLWASHAESLFAANPIFRVTLSGTINRHETGTLVVLPQLARIRVLTLAGARLDEPIKTLQILFNTPFFSALTTLDAHDALFSTRELGVLAASPLLARLHILDLSGTDIGARGIESLAAASMPHLRILRLAGTPIADAEVRTLAASPITAHLESLDLRRIPLRPATRALLLERFPSRVLLDACDSPGEP